MYKASIKEEQLKGADGIVRRGWVVYAGGRGHFFTNKNEAIGFARWFDEQCFREENDQMFQSVYEKLLGFNPSPDVMIHPDLEAEIARINSVGPGGP